MNQRCLNDELILKRNDESEKDFKYKNIIKYKK